LCEIRLVFSVDDQVQVLRRKWIFTLHRPVNSEECPREHKVSP
jgi:hypothetical protein